MLPPKEVNVVLHDSRIPHDYGHIRKLVFPVSPLTINRFGDGPIVISPAIVAPRDMMFGLTRIRSCLLRGSRQPPYLWLVEVGCAYPAGIPSIALRCLIRQGFAEMGRDHDFECCCPWREFALIFPIRDQARDRLLRFRDNALLPSHQPDLRARQMCLGLIYIHRSFHAPSSPSFQ